MKRALIMPLLKMNSGHHHVADSVVQVISDHYKCEKIELLSYTFGKGESILSNVYLKWITFSPSFYSSVYRRIALPSKEGSVPFKFYEKLFLNNMRKILMEYQPDLVICTHALPSFLLQSMKRRGETHVPVLNIYTDYFINDLWGTDGIDLHFIPDEPFVERLKKKNVPEANIMTTGIPTDPAIGTVDRRTHKNKAKYKIIISGGSQGTGRIERFIHMLKPGGRIDYRVLCGKNKKLYENIKQMNNRNIQAHSYIEDKSELNDLYEEADGIISKPGGVTVTEGLMKRLPTFIYDFLPGQEEYNFIYLQQQNLVQDLRDWRWIEEQLVQFLDDGKSFEALQDAIEDYHTRRTTQEILQTISNSISNHEREKINAK
ncbi:MGDG synthase family glycosyltransferase [Pseudalkalibacillus sp. SCS-8]|uniref:MGDG synthase family glycosyltransferase n=1 Tax=Pseudalkalibacillus nanhaiensis TaxID=3115291 RepID=UPI0032DB4228